MSRCFALDTEIRVFKRDGLKSYSVVDGFFSSINHAYRVRVHNLDNSAPFILRHTPRDIRYDLLSTSDGAWKHESRRTETSEHNLAAVYPAIVCPSKGD